MAKRYLFICVFLISATHLKAQQYGLFNTRTLFDAFENPAQKAFVLDSSRQFASNFLLPYFGLNAANKGDSKSTLANLINHGVYNTDNILIGNNNRNKLFESSNIYLLTFRIFQSYKYNKELGFSWQVRTDAFADYTNETLVVFDDYDRFTNKQDSWDGLLNGNGFAQSYHQFSITYRENLNKRLAFGAKLSLLSGITYNKVDITRSSLSVSQVTGDVSVGLTGTYKSSFLRAKELDRNDFLPNFKNPGLSVSVGTSYTAKSGVFIMANLKDLGFIRWNNNSHAFGVNSSVTAGTDINDPNGFNSRTLQDELENLFVKSDRQKGFYTPTNAKADFMISRRFAYYTPSLIVSKNLFYQGGDAVFVNSFKYKEFSVSLSPTYNMNGFGMLGTQGMYQTPNFEFFLGTDNLLRTAAIRKPATVNSGYHGGSVYMGLGIKFGYVVEHPQYSSYMPGVGDDTETSFFRRIFRVFQKKGSDN